jgi:hypothetical protein
MWKNSRVEKNSRAGKIFYVLEFLSEKNEIKLYFPRTYCKYDFLPQNAMKKRLGL